MQKIAIPNTPERAAMLMRFTQVRAECAARYAGAFSEVATETEDEDEIETAAREFGERFVMPVFHVEEEVHADLVIGRVHTHKEASALLEAEFPVFGGKYADCWAWALMYVLKLPAVYDAVCAEGKNRSNELVRLGWSPLRRGECSVGRDLVLYSCTTNDTTTTQHVGVVADERNEHGQQEVESKFGLHGVMRHLIHAIPPWYGDQYVVLRLR